MLSAVSTAVRMRGGGLTLHRRGSHWVLRTISSPQRSRALAQRPGGGGSPYWGCPELWGCGAGGCGQWAQWDGLELGISEVFSALNDCVVLWCHRGTAGRPSALCVTHSEGWQPGTAGSGWAQQWDEGWGCSWRWGCSTRSPGHGSISLHYTEWLMNLLARKQH